MGFIAILYGVVCYALFFVAFLYIVPFVGGDMVPFYEAPKTLDSGVMGMTALPAALVNIALLLVFAVHHSIFARPGFKKVLTKILPTSIERSTYVLVSTLLLIALYYYWVPMTDVVWSVQAPIWSMILTVLFFVGIGLVLAATFMLNHFELFGLMQVWHKFKGKEMPEATFREPFMYKSVRHPIYLGWAIFFWATPTMTTGHLLFASIWTIYMFVAIGYEERDLVQFFGDKYRSYQARVPMLLPIGRRKD